MFLSLTALMIFLILVFLSLAVVNFLPKSIFKKNIVIFNIVTIIVTSLIVIPPMIFFWSYPWKNLDNVASFLFLWLFVILSCYGYYQVLSFISKVNLIEEEKKQSFLYKFLYLLIMLCIVFSIFFCVIFLEVIPEVLPQPKICTKWELGKGTWYQVEVECNN